MKWGIVLKLTMDSAPNTFSSSYIKTIINYAIFKGAQKSILLNFLELKDEELDCSTTRVCAVKALYLLRLITQITGDHSFGLNLGQQFKPGTFEALGYAITSSATLKDAILTNSKYQAITQSLGKTGLYYEDNGRTAILEWKANIDDQELLRPISEAVFSGYICLGKWMIWQDPPVKTVEFRHEKPNDISRYREIFACPIKFNARRNAIHFESEFLTLPLQQSNSEVARLMLSRVEEQFSQMNEKHSTSKRVYAYIESKFGERIPTIQETALHFGFHERTLRRRLNLEQTTYKELVNQLKMKNAKSMLIRKNMDLIDIANTLGYQDQSAFCRAFRNWFQLSPKAFRDLHFNEASTTI